VGEGRRGGAGGGRGERWKGGRNVRGDMVGWRCGLGECNQGGARWEGEGGGRREESLELREGGGGEKEGWRTGEEKAVGME